MNTGLEEVVAGGDIRYKEFPKVLREVTNQCC